MNISASILHSFHSFLCLAIFSYASDTIWLPLGSSFNDSAQHYPSGTIFGLRSGLHRLQQVTPKNNQRFIGENQAIMSGARLLENWTKEGNLWVHDGQDQQGQVHGSCQDSFPNCKYPEDLFIDDSIMHHMPSKAQVVSGHWYFDYNADKVYIADDPSGKKMEIGTARSAFADSGANGVVIKNLVVVAAEGSNGITIVNQNRGEDWYSKNNSIHHNDVYFLGSTGQCGAASDYDVTNFWATGNNRFDYNRYHVPDTSDKHWGWNNAARSWGGILEQGQEAHGSIDTDISTIPNEADCSTKIQRDGRGGNTIKNKMLRYGMIERVAPIFLTVGLQECRIKNMVQSMNISSLFDCKGRRISDIQSWPAGIVIANIN